MRLPVTATCLIAIAIQLGCTVKTPLVEPLTPGKSGYAHWSGYGVVYALPRTAFDLQLTLSRTELAKPKCKAGPEQLKTLELDPSDIQPDGGVIYTIHASTVTTRSVPDPTRVFVSHFPSSSGWADSALVVKMGPAGTIEGAEGSASSQGVSVAAKVLELAGKVGAASVLLGSKSDVQASTSECQRSVDDYVTLARELKAYRGKPTPFSKETLDQYQKEIKAEQALIQALFMGKPTVTEGAALCSLAPSAAGKTPLLDFYPMAGVAPAAGVECQMDSRFRAPGPVPAANAVKKSSITLDADVVDEVMQQANAAGTDPSEAGFFYAVPVRALVSLGGHPKVVLAPTSHLLPQLGSVRALPRARGSSPALVVELYPDTGALKSVKVSNVATDFAGLVGSVTTGTSEVLTALGTRRDKAREAAQEGAAQQDPLAILTREQAMLDAELAIATAKEALRQLAQE